MSTPLQANTVDAMASLSPAPTQSIERDENEDDHAENDNAVADGVAQQGDRLGARDLDIIRAFVEELSGLKDEECVLRFILHLLAANRFFAVVLR